MCGIAGYLSLTPSSDSETVLRKMTGAIAHRGPDDSGFYHDAYAHLGHRRLSIIDLASGHQPMRNESGSLWIVYNGEVFNHAAVRPALEAAGHRYQSHCDTETILHAYEEYGPASIEHFRGMFAYAIWDRDRRRLFCVRDRLGIKPFYYYWDGRVFAFASEIKALLAHPQISADLNEAVLPEYLAFGYVSEEQTLFRGIRKLMPGHHLTLDLQSAAPSPQIQKYWDIPTAASEPDRKDQDWIRELRERLEETVRLRLMSDVPLGMFLSGGVDSSAIAALTRRFTDGPVKTFSVGYAEAQWSELSFAAEVARTLHTEHHEVKVSIDDFFNTLPRLIWHEDEPITWPSSVSLYFVSQLASRQVKVVLTGEGSDEIFGGYERYHWNLLNTRAAGLYKKVPSFIRGRLNNVLETSSLLNASLRRKIRHTFVGRELSIESLFLDNFYAAFSLREQDSLRSSAPDAVYSNYLRYWNSRNGSQLDRMLYADAKTYLVQLLMKQDRMSMACSIESRVPLLDHKLVEWSASIPDRMKIHGNTQKYVFKEAVSDLLPRSIVHRKKMGFPTPVRQWLLDGRAEPIYTALRDRRGFIASLIDSSVLERIISRHITHQEDATDRLWRLLNLQLWGDLFITGQKDRWWKGIMPTSAARETVPTLL